MQVRLWQVCYRFVVRGVDYGTPMLNGRTGVWLAEIAITAPGTGSGWPGRAPPPPPGQLPGLEWFLTHRVHQLFWVGAVLL